MIKPHNKRTLLKIRVKTRSKEQVIKFEDEVYYVHVKADPFRGQANAEVIKIVAKQLEIPATRLRIVSGKKSTNKTLLIEGMEPNLVHKKIKT